MKSISYELRYDGATADQVYTMLQDPAFREQVCDFQGVLRKSVSITTAGDEMSVKIDQIQAAQGIPSFAKKFVGDEINIVQEEQWSSPTSGDVKVTIPGKPGDMSGDVLIAEDDNGTTETVRMDVKVAIPLVGGKIEGLLADLLTKALRAENQVGRQWLAEPA
ncbi:MAG: DUF2505 domain-containing protein [Actinomycetota bacterium]|nr:DUF2505 domain-containing protein [Actinomycetota bacterium]